MDEKSEFEQLKDTVEAIAKDVANLTIDSTEKEIGEVQELLDAKYKEIQESVEFEEDEDAIELLEELLQDLEDSSSELDELRDEITEEANEDPDGDPDAEDKDGPDA